MFGYVRPQREELKVWEWEGYRAVYCGLCAALGRRHGLAARMFLNYDFTFLAMLLLPAQLRPELGQCRCPARLGCGKKRCTVPDPGMDLAADESVILTWWKLRDGVADGSWWKRTACRLLCVLLGRAYRRAAAARPGFARTVQSCLEELAALERENCPSLDRPADAFARLLQAAAPATGDEARDRATGQLLYHVGRWIYLIDAWDDRAEDRRRGSYNPVLARYGGEEEAHRAEFALTLRHSRNLAGGACALLERGCWQGVVENVLYLGLPAVERMVLQGTWKTRSQRNQTRQK